jgi:hypothetical protein
MEPEDSSPYTQPPATCSYPEPAQSSPCFPNQFLKIRFNIVLPSTPRSSNSVHPLTICLYIPRHLFCLSVSLTHTHTSWRSISVRLEFCTVETRFPRKVIIIIIIIFFLYGLGRLTYSGIDAVPSFHGASSVSSPSRFVVEGLPSRRGRKGEARLRETHWSSKNRGFADWLVTLPRKIKVLISKDAQPSP